MKNKLIDINEVKIKNLGSISPDFPKIRKEIDFGNSYDGKSLSCMKFNQNGIIQKEFQHLEFAKVRDYKSR